MNENRPLVGVTIGDAAGIGPEIVVKSLAEPGLYELCRPLVIGDARIVRRALDLGGLQFDIRIVATPAAGSYQPGCLDLLEIGWIDPAQAPFGRLNAALGEAAVQQSLEAARLALAGQLDAIASAPVNKEAMRLAGHRYEGQTQLFGEFCGAKKWGMLLIFGSVRCFMLTTHMSLLEAIRRVTADKLLDALELMQGSMDLFAPERRPIIAVSALNPHAGENGLFGREEIEQITPAVAEARRRWPHIKTLGPIPSDTLFVRARAGEFDAVVSLFHDQANLAMKLLGFGEMTTYILGLPIIRTSVGHGTAFDIAGTNKASHGNMRAAIEQAARLAGLNNSKKEKQA
jgi:4-hydroxythreonine-4-phosphate dehydrogenase